MDRDTKEISIGGHSFSVKTYATAREARAIEQALFKGSRLEMAGEQPKIAEFNTGAAFEQEQELVRQMVLAFDGSADAIVDRCLDLPSEQFDELVGALDALVSKKKS